MACKTALAQYNEQSLNQLLSNGLLTADRFINKNYLIDISEQTVIPLRDSERSKKVIRMFRVTKLVYDSQENSNDKLISVYSALQNIDSTALLVVDGTGKGIDFYIGIRSNNNATVSKEILKKSFISNFPGSNLENMKNSEIDSLLQSVVESKSQTKIKNISCVTVVPSMRDEDKEKFVQGMEKFVDTMQGEVFTAVFVARPVSKAELEIRKRGFEELYSSLSPFIKTSLAYGENYSKAVTNGMFENFSHSINHSISNTTGGNASSSTSHSHGMNHGVSMGGGGFGMNNGTMDSTTNGYSSGRSWSQSVTEGSADTSGTGTNQSNTETSGTSRTLTIEHQNKAVVVLLNQIDEQMERIKACEVFGVWECAAYFVADDIQSSVVAANTYQALMLGEDTGVENSFVNVWDFKTRDNRKKVLDYIRYGLHPVIEIAPEAEFNKQFVTPATYISGRELPLLMGLPHKSVTGLTVSEIAEFGRNVFVHNARKGAKTIRLGNVYHMGKTEHTSVDLDLNSFTSHCFITGSTGSGKSNTSYCLLEKFYQNGIPFLVIEPAKGEYKEAFGAIPDINIFSTNPLIGQMLKLNPFRFDTNIHVLEHLDRLIEIFNACWEMYAAMPAILKTAIEKIYVEKGWDLLNSVYTKGSVPLFPTFEDLMTMLPAVISQSGYSADTKGDYTGALVTRVTSLTNGISGQIFCDNYDIPDTIMFDQNTIVDLSRVGSSETKSLIMGIMVLKLSEYRMANANQANSGLRHVTVLEEAHNLLKRTSPGQSNVIAKSVEMICNSIAEMRTYGEGFVIVDQSPTAVDIATIKNTNTKILMRLPEKSDCEAVGHAVGLGDNQIRELSKLGTGIAVVMQNNWLEAVLTNIDVFSNHYEKVIEKVSYDSIKALRGAVIKELIDQYMIEKRGTDLDLNRFYAVIESVDIVPGKQAEMRYCIESIVRRLQQGKDIHFFCQTILNLSGAKNLFDFMAEHLQLSKNDSTVKYEKDSIEKWQSSFRANLRKYVDLPKKYRERMVKYLLHAQLNPHSSEQNNVDYATVYNILYPPNPPKENNNESA